MRLCLTQQEWDQGSWDHSYFMRLWAVKCRRFCNCTADHPQEQSTQKHRVKSTDFGVFDLTESYSTITNNETTDKLPLITLVSKSKNEENDGLL